MEETVARSLLCRSLDLPEDKGEVVSLFFWRDFHDLDARAASRLVLLESKWLNSGWSSRTEIRSHFEQFCQVEGIAFLASRGELRRAVVAFPNVSVAFGLVRKGSTRLGVHEVKLREVSSVTLNG